jgi:hypothetical protein
MRRILLMICCLLLGGMPARAAVTMLDSCGQTVDDAVLAADLDCSATEGFAVTIAAGGRLSLAGHQIVSGFLFNGTSGGVLCLGNCMIEGAGGSLVSAFQPGVYGGVYPRGVQAPYYGRGTVTISGTTISGYNTAVIGKFLIVDSSTFTNNIEGLLSRAITITNSTIAGTYDGIMSSSIMRARKLTISDCSFSGSSSVYGGRVQMTRTTVTGMQYYGVWVGRKSYLEDSVITGNCLTDLPIPCADIYAESWRPPVLVDTTCETSIRDSPHSMQIETWGICSLD